jgi:hypothetical protein
MVVGITIFKNIFESKYGNVFYESAQVQAIL